MFENPFTRESKKAKKSLLAKEKIRGNVIKKNIEIDNLLSQVEEFGDLKVQKSQLIFLNDLINTACKEIGITKDKARDIILSGLQSLDMDQFEKGILDAVSGIDDEGNIIFIDLGNLRIRTMPRSVINLIKLENIFLPASLKSQQTEIAGLLPEATKIQFEPKIIK